MKRFKNGQRVQVVTPDQEHAKLINQCGTVVRLLIRDESAWVRMDNDPGDELARFPVGDDRRNDVNLFPDECEAA